MNTPSPTPRYIKTECAYLALEFRGHDSIEEYDREAGCPGAALEYAERWHIHRDTINIFDERFTPWLEETSGIKRGTDTKVTEKRKLSAVNPDRITPIPERLVTYLKRVVALRPELKPAIMEKALSLSREIKVNVAPKSITSIISPQWFKRAESWLNITDLDTLNMKIAPVQAEIPQYELVRDNDGRPLRDSLARLLQMHDNKIWSDKD